jgi:hypothetical protein
LDIVNAVFDRLEAWQSLITFALGYVLASWQEGRRDRQQDRRNRDQQWRERQLNAIAECQVAIAESMHGVWLTNRALENYFVTTVERISAGKMPEFPEVTDEKWHQDWLASIRKMETMATRVQDPALLRAVESFNAVRAKIHDLKDPEARDQEFAELEGITQEALLLAGRLYREFDAPPGDS